MAQDRTKDYLVPGGVRIELEKNGTGYRDLGNIVDANLEKVIELLEHFSNRTGTRTRDAVRVTSKSINLTGNIDEWNAQNAANLLGSSAVTEVTAGAHTVTDSVVVLTGTTTSYFWRDAASIVSVKSLDGTTTYSGSTDYELNDGGIRRKSGGVITSGSEVKVTWTTDLPALAKMPVLDGGVFTGKARLWIQPTDGPRILWEIPKVEFTAAGSIGIQDTEFQSMPFTLSVQSDTTDPDAPFGYFYLWHSEDE